MKTLSKFVAAGLLAGASLSANALNVAGVEWDPSSIFDFSSNSNLIEDLLDLPAGQNELTGFGIITSINQTTESTFCPLGCELTYSFSGFTVAAPPIVDANGDTILAFTGGTINFFVDYTTPYTAQKRANAEDGTLWLSLTGHAVANALFPGVNPTLVGVLTSFGAGADAGSGDGLLDVAGGAAATRFDTDTQTDGADFVFSSSFQPFASGGATDEGYELFGTADLRGNSIPVPSSIMLLGLGLLGMGAGMSKRKNA